MVVKLGANILSQTVQRQLGRATTDLASVSERLSSGQRINRASDDAAGLAIATSLNAQPRVATTGIRNLNDGISLLSIAEGALGELSNVVTRLVELAEQATTGTLTNRQRSALDREAQALNDEYMRIVQSTEFNGRKVLTAEMGELRLQAGVGVDGGIASTLGGVVGTGGLGTPTLITTTTSAPSSLEAGDFNNDGILDMVHTRGSLAVSLGLGDGTFGPTTTYATGGSSPSGVIASDFNGDGVLDLVTANSSNRTIGVCIGRGDGTFSSGVTYATGAGANINDITVGDFNNDGRQDILSANKGSGASLFVGDGNGGFSRTLASSTGTTLVEAGDFNGDRVLDFAYFDGTSTIGVQFGNGDGTFGVAFTYTTSGAVAFDLISGDFNEDGVSDLAVAYGSAAGLGIYLGSSGGFSPETRYASAGGNFYAVTLGDFNGDGNLDLVGAASGVPSGLTRLTGRGDGTFGPQTDFTSSFGVAAPRIDSGDFNGDGVLDLITGDLTALSINFVAGLTTAGTAPILPFSLTTSANARQALPILTRKLDQLGAQRGQIGAFQSRIDVAIRVQQASTENFRAAESRIKDADIASESADYVRLSILQRAATALLASANQQPSLTLRLLS